MSFGPPPLSKKIPTEQFLNQAKNILKNANLLDEKTNKLLEEKKEFLEIPSILDCLERAKILNKENVFLLLNNAEYVSDLSDAITELNARDLFNKEVAQINYLRLLKNPQYMHQVSLGMCQLAIKKDLYTEENINIIINNPKDAFSIAQALVRLKKYNLLNDPNKILLITHKEHSSKIEANLDIYYISKKTFPPQEFFDFIIKTISNNPNLDYNVLQQMYTKQQISKVHSLFTADNKSADNNTPDTKNTKTNDDKQTPSAGK